MGPDAPGAGAFRVGCFVIAGITAAGRPFVQHLRGVDEYKWPASAPSGVLQTQAKAHFSQAVVNAVVSIVEGTVVVQTLRSLEPSHDDDTTTPLDLVSPTWDESRRVWLAAYLSSKLGAKIGPHKMASLRSNKEVKDVLRRRLALKSRDIVPPPPSTTRAGRQTRENVTRRDL